MPARGEKREDVQAVVIGQRMRVHGLTEDQARAQMETGILSRLRIVGDISAREHEALLRFAADKRRYDQLMAAPRAVTGTDALARLIAPAPDPERRLVPRLATERDVLDQRDIDRFAGADMLLTGRIRWAVYLVAVEGGWRPESLPLLRMGATRLAAYYRLPET